MIRSHHVLRVKVSTKTLLGGLLAGCAFAAPLASASIEDTLGRNEVRVWSDRFCPEVGTTSAGAALVERLERLGYLRVRGQRPEHAGEYFFGTERFFVSRRAHRHAGGDAAARRIGWALGAGGAIEGFLDPDGRATRSAGDHCLAPELLAESLDELRARRELVALEQLPEHVYRAVLAIEDARFFDHRGVDGRAVARALLANLRQGGVAQGGSTITQQLIKLRDLSPKRTLGRKLSEAWRALALEEEHSKEEILEAYLNAVYFGHVDGVALYGLGAAARAYVGKSPRALDLGEAAMFAAMIQGPNRLEPRRHAEALRARQLLVLRRMEELGWASAEAAAAVRGLPRLRVRAPPPEGPRHLIGKVRALAADRAPERAEEGRGVVAWLAVDPLLQAAAERAARSGLDRLREQHRRLRGEPLAVALVALDARTGRVLAWVGGDPARRGDAFDRVERARRQPGSTVKPFVLLEAFERCGEGPPLYPARLVVDLPLVISLPSGRWQPQNADARFRERVSVRQALRESLNVPLVRVARHCGFEHTAARFRSAGLPVLPAGEPAFVLGAAETSPLELAEAYTSFAELGTLRRALPVLALETPGGRELWRGREQSRRVARAASAYLVRDVLAEIAGGLGLAGPGAPTGPSTFGKTGTSSESRDAWFVGGAGPVVAVVWVGLDSGALGVSGTAAALPIWREFMSRAAPSRPAPAPALPAGIVRVPVDEDTGLRVRRVRAGAREEVFRAEHTPPRKRWYRADRPPPPIE